MKKILSIGLLLLMSTSSFAIPAVVMLTAANTPIPANSALSIALGSLKDHLYTIHCTIQNPLPQETTLLRADINQDGQQSNERICLNGKQVNHLSYDMQHYLSKKQTVNTLEIQQIQASQYAATELVLRNANSNQKILSIQCNAVFYEPSKNCS